MSSSDDPGNWKDEDTQSETWGLDHSTALAILGACVVGFALLILVALLVYSCVVDRRKAKQQDEEQQQQDPFATAQFSAKNAVFQASHQQELAAPMSKGKSAGEAGSYGDYGTQDGMPGVVAEQYAPPVGNWAGGADPYTGYGSQGAMQGGYAQPYRMPQYDSQWYQQQQQAAPPGSLYDTEQMSMGWPQQPYEAPPAGVKTTGAWS